ncbi:ankyrin repeat domain-containing protein [Marinomonas posidonica]|uniref:Ankyrin n=1 Tax=Marinomonas posidonica (strain CECT 7376 / NCIMB 14433 / IVIA-Po-181) TaxID=491952 RepID=F6CWW6_MARPP|nr:ankyrin repeat domain-containing protein [Marinomonas posidonica]AEF55528.1 Ankyrin [Marinomonas posidonica IVIA-Po-181]
MKAQTKWTIPAVILCSLALQACSIFSPYTSHFQGIKERLQEGQEINAPINENLDTYLHQSVQNNSFKEVKYLLNNGANPNLANKQGRLPIHLLNTKKTLTSDEQQANILSILAKFGADINTKGIDQKTPIIEAIINNKPLSVETLLEYQADIEKTYQSNTPLMLAVQTGNITIVNDLLSKHQKFNRQNNANHTAMHFTALAETKGTDKELAKIAKKLLKSGVKIQESYQKDIINEAIKNHRPLVARVLMEASETRFTPNRDLFSPLMDAVYTGDLSLVKSILKQDVDVNFKDSKGWTALLLSSHKSSENEDDQQTSIIKRLIKSGATLDTLNKENNSALNMAIESGRYDIADMLIEEHINTNLKNIDGETALIKAIQVNNIELVEQLISAESIHTTDAHLWTPLHFSVAHPDTQEKTEETSITEFLLSLNANLNAQNDQGETPLHTAIKHSATNDAILLLEQGADTSIQDNNGVTPLMLAAQANNLVLIKRLITTKQDINTQDSYGKTALHYATLKKSARNDYTQAQIVKLLINAGANPNLQDKNLSTPLHLSVKYNLLHTTNALTKADTIPDIKDNQGNTALITAVQNGNYPIVKILAQQVSGLDFKQNNGWAAIHFTAHPDSKGNKATQAKIAQALIKAGANINIQIPTGETPLSIAIGNDQGLVTQALIEAGARMDIVDNNGWTPLMFAVYLGKLDSLKQALKVAKNLNIKNKDGMTALHLTTNPSSFGGTQVQAQIAKLLISKGADVNARASDGSTPLHFAASNNMPEIIKILLSANASQTIKNFKGWTAKDEALKTNSTQALNLLN